MGGLSVPLSAAQKPAAPRYNVLFIAIDDLNVSLGCYDHPLVKSPNIDRLAARGVRFDRAYCQYPLCNPSRSSLLSGLRPDTSRIYDNGIPIRRRFPTSSPCRRCSRTRAISPRASARFTITVCPDEIGTSGLDDPPSWNQFVNPRGRDKDDEPDVINFTPDRHLGAALCWMEAKGTDEEQTDGKVAAEAIRLLEEHKDKPFFLAVGFYRPHVPDIATKPYFALYPLEKVTLPKEPPEHIANIPPIALTHQAAQLRPRRREAAHLQTRLLRQHQLRGRAGRQSARRARPAEAGGQYHRGLVGRPRLVPGRTRPMAEAIAV